MSQPSHRLTEWIAMFEMEPFGPIRDNLHSATLAAICFNPHVKKQDMKSPDHFMWADRPRKQNRAEKEYKFINDLKTLVH